MPKYEGRHPWRVVFRADGRSDIVWTQENPGQLKGPIILEHNSIGGCIGGELQVEGYLDWPEFTRSCKVELNVNGTYETIWIGAVGQLESTLSESGKRTTRVPLVDYAELDADGLAQYGWRTFHFTTGSTPLEAGAFPHVPWQFGQTNADILNKKIENKDLASWGYQVSGHLVVGIPSSLNSESVSSNDDRLFIMPAGHEKSRAVTEYATRPKNGWTGLTANRAATSGMHKRKAAKITTDESIEDEEISLKDGQNNITWPLIYYRSYDMGSYSTNGYIKGIVDLNNVVRSSVNNPDLTSGSNYEPISISIRIRLELTDIMDAISPSSWNPLSEFAKDYWAQYFIRQDFPELMPKDETSARSSNDEFLYKNKIIDYKSMENLGHPKRIRQMYDKHRRAAWDARFHASAMHVSWAEWLTTSSSINNVVVNRIVNLTGDSGDIALPAERDPEIHFFGYIEPSTPPPSGVSTMPIPGSLTQQNIMKYAYNKGHGTSYTVNDVNPLDDSGTIATGYSQATTLKQLGQVFDWTFEVPQDKLRQIDKDLPSNYKYAFAVGWRGQNGFRVRATVEGVKYKRKVQKLPDDPNELIPNYSAPLREPETKQGHLNGIVLFGPARIAGEYVTHSRIILSDQSYRTEFQLGGRQK